MRRWVATWWARVWLWMRADGWVRIAALTEAEATLELGQGQRVLATVRGPRTRIVCDRWAPRVGKVYPVVGIHGAIMRVRKRWSMAQRRPAA